MEKKIFSRHFPFFGKEGQEKIEEIHVGFVGLGGTGSHVAQQLAYIGVKKFTIIDKDFVEGTDLNRLIGATVYDLEGPSTKVAVAERMIRQIRSETECTIASIQGYFPSKASLTALKDVDIIWGCVDRDGPRLILNEFTCVYEKPYIDLATEIHLEERSFGGRVFFSIPGKSCLHCRGELSLDEIRRDLQSETEKIDEEAIYGVPKRDLGGSGPSVVSLNEIIASLAVTEFMVFVTGVRPPKEFLIYDGAKGIVKVNTDAPVQNCYYCNFIKGIGDIANVERFIQEKL